MAAVMATATATVGGCSKDDNGAVQDKQGRWAEEISVEGNNKDCGADARSLLAAVVQL